MNLNISTPSPAYKAGSNRDIRRNSIFIFYGVMFLVVTSLLAGVWVTKTPTALRTVAYWQQPSGVAPIPGFVAGSTVSNRTNPFYACKGVDGELDSCTASMWFTGNQLSPVAYCATEYALDDRVYITPVNGPALDCVSQEGYADNYKGIQGKTPLENRLLSDQPATKTAKWSVGKYTFKRTIYGENLWFFQREVLTEGTKQDGIKAVWLCGHKKPIYGLRPEITPNGAAIVLRQDIKKQKVLSVYRIKDLKLLKRVTCPTSQYAIAPIFNDRVQIAYVNSKNNFLTVDITTS